MKNSKNMNDKRITTEVRSLSAFNSLKVDDIADVTIKQEGKREIKISAEENLLSKVMTKIKK